MVLIREQTILYKLDSLSVGLKACWNYWKRLVGRRSVDSLQAATALALVQLILCHRVLPFKEFLKAQVSKKGPCTEEIINYDWKLIHKQVKLVAEFLLPEEHL
ncbi:unnamed protein product [Nezara viridula]|uniref:Uncharacterized protein n=1 Tax=Nezara viridula TaxID=85310 RepID=A0A9P0H9U7_NEZVI|nr:unnamed protein product [Nezara viridula]